MKEHLIYLLLTSSLVTATATTSQVESSQNRPSSANTAPASADSSSTFWSRFSNGFAKEGISNPQLYSAAYPTIANPKYVIGLLPQTGGYTSITNPQLIGSSSEAYPQKHKQQEPIPFSTYPSVYQYQSTPNQQAQFGNHIGNTNLLPSFQALTPGGIQLSYQPTFTSFPYNFTQSQISVQNASASESLPVYPALQNAYFPSAVSVPQSWPSFTLSALQPSSSNSALGHSITSVHQPASNTGFLNSLAPVTFQNQYQYPGQGRYQFPGFPLSAYTQTYTLPGPKQSPSLYGRPQGSIQTTATPLRVQNPSNNSPTTSGKNQYSSKYSKQAPQVDSENKERYAKKYPQEIEDDESEYNNDNLKKMQHFKSSESSYKSQKPKYNDEDDDNDDDGDDDNSADYKNSFDYAEDLSRPKFSRPSGDEDSEESSEYSKKSCDSYKQTPSKSASSFFNKFSDDHRDFSSANFEDQFKSFPTNENFKDPDFSPDSSQQKSVTEYYKQPASQNGKHFKMGYSHTGDTYMSPTQQKGTEVPKTLHYYNYKAPKYSYDKQAEYFPNNPFKATSEQYISFTTHRPTTINYRARDSTGRHSITTTVTNLKNMYK